MSLLLHLLQISDLEAWDRAIVLACNSLHTPWLDAIMRFATSRLGWLPLYVLLVGWLVYRLRRRVWPVLIGIVLLVVLTDQISTAFKEPWGRLRPCHEPDVAVALHLPDGCGGRYGAVSSHAANTMGIALFLLLLPRTIAGFAWPSGTKAVLAGWVLLVGLSRIYLGAHYPTDIVRGWLLGLLLAWLVLWLHRRFGHRLVRSGSSSGSS